MASPNLNLTHVTANQNNKETTVNAAVDGLDNAMNGLLNLAVTGNTTLTSAQFRGAYIFILNGSPAAAFAFNVAADIKRAFAVVNLTNRQALIGVSGGGSDSVALASGASGIFYSDDDDITQIGSGSGAAAASGISITSFSASRSMTDADLAGNVVLRYTGGSAANLYIESSLSGTEPVTLIQTGAGQVTIVEGSGVSFIEPDGLLKTRKAGSVVQIIPLGSDTYVLVGDLA